MPGMKAWRRPWLHHVNSWTRRRLYFYLFITYSAASIGKERTFDGRYLWQSAGALQIRAPKEGFNTKMEPQRYPKQPKWSKKGCQNKPRNLHRHTCGRGSKKYRTNVPKDANRAHFGSKSLRINKNTIQKSFNNSVLEKHGKVCQNDAKRVAEIIVLSICLRKDDFRQLLVLLR